MQADDGWDSADRAEDGSPLDQTTLDVTDSAKPMNDAGDSGAQDVTLPDVSGDTSPLPDGTADSSQSPDAPDDVEDAAVESSMEAGCGSLDEPCCLPAYACTSGLTCNGGTVMCVCVHEMCAGQCVDVTTDKNNCGTCGNTCTASEACISGRCGCSDYNFTPCSGVCVDPLTDPANCGGCGINCQTVTGDASAQCVMGDCRTRSVVASGAAHYYGVAADAAAVYYSTSTTVEALPKAGGPAVVLASGLGAPAQWLLVDGASIYWSAFDSTSGGVYSCPLGGCTGGPMTLATITSPVVDMVMDATTLYWGTRVDVLSCPKTGGGLATPIAMGAYPAYVAVDAQNVYWSDYYGNAIYSCAPSGCTAAPTPFMTSVGSPEGLFVDGTSFYWAATPGGLYGCTLPGCAATKVTIATTGMEEPAQLLGDATNLYWSMGYTDYLGRAPRSGGNVTGMAWAAGPVPMAIDSTYLYWIDQLGTGVYSTPK